MFIIGVFVLGVLIWLALKLDEWTNRENYKEFLENNPDALHLVRRNGVVVLKQGYKTVNLSADGYVVDARSSKIRSAKELLESNNSKSRGFGLLFFLPTVIFPAILVACFLALFGQVSFN